MCVCVCERISFDKIVVAGNIRCIRVGYYRFLYITIMFMITDNNLCMITDNIYHVAYVCDIELYMITGMLTKQC